ncbi:MAG: metallophosphoesterase [Polyangiales bacterium]
MTVIAHLSDPHLLEHGFERRSRREEVRLRYLNWGRAMNPATRVQRLRDALIRAWAARPDHLLITGDLTEEGTTAQFELAAEILSESPFAPGQVTLVPGNHDIYHRRDAWLRALEGPLRPWAPTSDAHTAVELRGVTVFPISTVKGQSWLFSYGFMGTDPLRRIADVAGDAGGRGDAVVVPQHHAPVPLKSRFMQHFDGLRDHHEVSALLRKAPNLTVIHGHVHERRADAVEPTRGAQVYAVGAVFDDADAVRFYRAEGGVIEAMEEDPQPYADAAE